MVPRGKAKKTMKAEQKGRGLGQDPIAHEGISVLTPGEIAEWTGRRLKTGMFGLEALGAHGVADLNRSRKNEDQEIESY